MENIHEALKFSSNKEKIIFRQKASDGIWAAFLLPLSIILGGWKTNGEAQLYASSSVYSLNLLLNILHLLYHISRNKSLYVSKSLNIIFAIPSSISMFFYVNILHFDFRQSFCYTVANALIYFEGLPFILKVFPNSFTFGEANVAIQGISIFLFSTFTRLNKVLSSDVPSDEYNICTTILQVGHLGVLVLCIMPFALQSLRNAISMYIWIGCVTFGFIMYGVDYIIGKNPFEWLWSFLMQESRIPILTLWLACSVIAGLLCWQRILLKKQADTVVRKYFHILADIVFVTGVIFDINLIYFASGSVLAIFILLEIFRIMKLPPLHEFLQNSYLLYADEKDSGIVALTPIYLLVGYSIPLWIHPLKTYTSKEYLQLLSGVLCVGVGDTAASIAGNIFGKHYWKGSKKTIEGTFACVFGQILSVLCLIALANVKYSGVEYVKILLSIIIPSLVEALTDQIDNIILPMITYILLLI